MWDSGNGRKLWQFQCPVRESTGDSDSDSDDDEQTKRVKKNAISRVSPSDLAWSLDGMQLVTGHYDGMCRVVTAEGQVLHAWQAHKELVRAVAVSCEGLIASCSQDSSICVWRAKQPLEMPELESKAALSKGEAKGEAAEVQAEVEAMTMTEPSTGSKPMPAPIYHPLDDTPSAEID